VITRRRENSKTNKETTIRYTRTYCAKPDIIKATADHKQKSHEILISAIVQRAFTKRCLASGIGILRPGKKWMDVTENARANTPFEPGQTSTKKRELIHDCGTRHTNAAPAAPARKYDILLTPKDPNHSLHQRYLDFYYPNTVHLNSRTKIMIVTKKILPTPTTSTKQPPNHPTSSTTQTPPYATSPSSPHSHLQQQRI
jgi:hypothetical protein